MQNSSNSPFSIHNGRQFRYRLLGSKIKTSSRQPRTIVGERQIYIFNWKRFLCACSESAARACAKMSTLIHGRLAVRCTRAVDTEEGGGEEDRRREKGWREAVRVTLLIARAGFEPAAGRSRSIRVHKQLCRAYNSNRALSDHKQVRPTGHQTHFAASSELVRTKIPPTLAISSQSPLFCISNPVCHRTRTPLS